MDQKELKLQGNESRYCAFSKIFNTILFWCYTIYKNPFRSVRAWIKTELLQIEG
jgi:hypothetical protein